MALSDRIALYRMSRLITLISGVTGLEHLERPEYLSQVERLNTNRRQLASAPRQLLSNIASSARIIAFIVLLATVSPWLLLVPLAAAPPLVADRIAKKLTRQADDEMAHDRRLAASTPTTGSQARPPVERFPPGCNRRGRQRLRYSVTPVWGTG